MAKALTAKAVEAAKPDPDKRRETADGAMQGLYLVIQPGGAKSWALRYRHGGKPRKMTLGRFPSLGLRDARDEAGRALRLLEHGTDPGAAKVEAKRNARDADDTERDTVAAVVALFLKRHASRNRRAADQAAMFRRDVIPKWGDRRIQEITRRDAVGLLDGIVDRGSPIAANRVRALLNTLFGWARSRDIVEANPLDGVRPPAPEKPRDRVLTGDELRLLWQAAGELGEPFGPLVRVLLLTGQRRGEVAGMTDREVSGETWTIPAARSKNGDEHTVPLSEAVQAILAGVHRIKGPAGYVFSTTGLSPVSGFTRASDRLRATMAELAGEPVEAFTLHDLRRTAATGMAGLGFPPHIVEAVLNHRSGTRRGAAGVYNRFDYAAEKRAALEAWARHVLALVEGRPANVVALAGAR